MTPELISDPRHLASAAVGSLFVLAGVFKLLSRDEFHKGLLQVPYVRERWARFLATAVPLAEIVSGSVTMAGYLFGHLAVVVLLLAFAAAAFMSAKKGVLVPCSCFGAGSKAFLSEAVAVRNCALIPVVALGASATGGPTLLSGVTGATAMLLTLCLVQSYRVGSEIRNKTSPAS